MVSFFYFFLIIALYGLAAAEMSELLALVQG